VARKYLTPIDLTGLELTNFKVQNLTSDPSAYGKGHTYYNTTHNELRTYNGTAWVPVGGSVMAGSTVSRPAAGNAGRLYFDTTLNVLFYDNGSTWTQDGVSQSDLSSAISGVTITSTDGLSEGTTNLYFTTQRAREALSGTDGVSYSSSSGTFSINYTSLESQLVTDGFAKTSDIPSLSGYVTETGTETLSNKTFSDNLHFNDGTDAGYIRGLSGTLKIEANNALQLNADADITITSNAGDIVINPDGTAYIGSKSSNNRIATIGDINADLYITSVSSPLSVTAGNLSIDLGDYQTTAGLDTAVGNLGYAKTVDIPSAYITAVDSNIFAVDSGTLQLKQYVNDINGEIHLKKNEYWIDGDQTGTQYGIVTANSYSGHFNVVAVGRDLELEAQSGNTIWLNTTGIIRATYNGSYDAFSVNTDAAVTVVRNILDVTNNDGYSTININGNDGQINLNNPVTDITSGYIKTNGNDLTVHSDNTLVVEAGALTLYSDNNNINATSSFSTADGHNITSGNNLYVANGIYAGGADTETDGYVHIMDAAGNNTFVVSAGSGAATVDVHGSQHFYESQPDGGTEYGTLSYDGDVNFVITANQNHLILNSDSSQYYLGSVADGNKIVKKSDLTELSSGLSWKLAVNLLWDDTTLTASGATGTLALDGHPALTQANDGYRILTINMGADSGIYTYHDDGTNWFVSRSSDADAYTKLIGAAVFVMEGTKYAATSWVQSNHYITDFTGQTWVQFSGQGTYTAGNGINIDGREISVKLDSDSLSESTAGLKVNYHTDGGLDNDGGLYVKTANGVKIDNSGNVTIDTDVVVRKYAATIGDGSATSYAVTHNLGTQDVQVSVYDTATYEEVTTDVVRTNTNVVTIGFAVAPTTGAYRVVVHA
jgi:hypothetical protein